MAPFWSVKVESRFTIQSKKRSPASRVECSRSRIKDRRSVVEVKVKKKSSERGAALGRSASAPYLGIVARQAPREAPKDLSSSVSSRVVFDCLACSCWYPTEASTDAGSTLRSLWRHGYPLSRVVPEVSTVEGLFLLSLITGCCFGLIKEESCHGRSLMSRPAMEL